MSNMSPAPGTPQTSAKAYIGAAVSFVAAFLSALLVVWTDTDPLQARDFIVALSAALGTGALTGVVVHQTQNQPLV